MINRTDRISPILIAASVMMLGASMVSASEGLSKADKYFAKATQYELEGNLDKAARYRAKAERYAGGEQFELVESDGFDPYGHQNLSKADKYFLKASRYEAEGDLEKAARYRAKAERYAAGEESEQSKAEKYGAKAAAYAAAGDHDKAAKYAAKALKYANEEGNSKAAKYAAKAEQLALEGDLEKAAYYAAKARKYAGKYNDNCWPQVGADFAADGMTVHVESTQDLSNVVILFADGTTQRIESLDGLTLTLAGFDDHAGTQISGVWIKSGCNHSGDGPSYGEFIENSSEITGLPVVSINGAPTTVEDGEGQFTEAMFAISLSEMVPFDSNPVTVELRTVNGTAESGQDYVAENMTLTFEPGELSIQISILIIGDATSEPWQEHYSVELSNPVNALLGQSWTNGTIIDNDDDIEY